VASTRGNAVTDVMVDGKPWTPKNYDDRYEGPVTVRRALEGSLNTATVRVAQAVGLPVVIETARTLGVEVDLRPVPALTLGVFEITPLALARAYLPLANGGLAPAGGVVEAVADDGGRALWSASREARPVIGAPEAPDHLAVGGRGHYGTMPARAAGVPGAAGKTERPTRPGRLVGHQPTTHWSGGLRRRHAGWAIRLGALPIWSEFMRQHSTSTRRCVPGAGRHRAREGGRDHRPSGHRVLSARGHRGIPGRQRAPALRGAWRRHGADRALVG
jgi:membrane peptidoglycan carboxypeptidase